MLASLRSAAPAAGLLALMAVAACGGDDDDDGGTAVDAGPGAVDAAAPGADAAPAGPGLDELAQPLAGALCPYLFQCCSTDDLQEVFGDEGEPPADVAACVTSLTPIMDEEVSDIAASVAAGRISYDPARMAACLEVIAEGSCASVNEVFDDVFTFPGCQPPFAALVELDGACASDQECKSGYCPGRVDDEPGACAERPGEGEKCEFDCADGFTCDDIGSTCIPQRADGETCDGEDQCLSGACLDGICGVSPVCDGED